jgi:hypothetical protein
VSLLADSVIRLDGGRMVESLTVLKGKNATDSTDYTD